MTSTHRHSRHTSSDRSRKHEVSYLLNDQPSHSSSAAGSGSRAQHGGHRGSHANGIQQRSVSQKAAAFEARVIRNTCQQCGHCFAQSADLRKHVRTVHEGLRPFRCDLCDKSFGEKGNLRKHRRSVHFNERPFQCHVCPSSFAFKDGLARHIKLVHYNARPFVCRLCGSSYKQVSQLRRHAETCNPVALGSM